MLEHRRVLMAMMLPYLFSMAESTSSMFDMIEWLHGKGRGWPELRRSGSTRLCTVDLELAIYRLHTIVDIVPKPSEARPTLIEANIYYIVTL